MVRGAIALVLLAFAWQARALGDSGDVQAAEAENMQDVTSADEAEEELAEEEQGEDDDQLRLRGGGAAAAMKAMKAAPKKAAAMKVVKKAMAMKAMKAAPKKAAAMKVVKPPAAALVGFFAGDGAAAPETMQDAAPAVDDNLQVRARKAPVSMPADLQMTMLGKTRAGARVTDNAADRAEAEEEDDQMRLRGGGAGAAMKAMKAAPKKAAAMKVPSVKLWKKSPMRIPLTMRNSSVMPVGPLIKLSIWSSRTAITQGKRMPARMGVPHFQAMESRSWASRPTSFQIMVRASGRTRRKAVDKMAPAPKAEV